MTIDIALAASAREWPDRLHRFLLDHGGGRIVDRVMSPDHAVDSQFDILIIDDVCSFLSPHLVTQVKQRGADVIGVFVPEDGADAKRRLLECGISDVLEADALPAEVVDKIQETLAHRSPTPDAALTDETPLAIGVTGPSEGVGMTEVSIALARALAVQVPTVLIDLDPVWPSVAQRLDLPLHPNIRTALDNVLHTPDRVLSSLHVVGGLKIVGGRADGGVAAPIGRHEMKGLLHALAPASRVVVADLGPHQEIEGGALREFDTAVIVGRSDPVGVARSIKTIDRVHASNPDQPVLAVMNLATRSRFHRVETLGELNRAFPAIPVVTLPFDRRLGDSAWNGTAKAGRRYRRSVGAIASLVVKSLR